MFNYVKFKAEFVVFVSLKVPSGCTVHVPVYRSRQVVRQASWPEVVQAEWDRLAVDEAPGEEEPFDELVRPPVGRLADVVGEDPAVVGRLLRAGQSLRLLGQRLRLADHERRVLALSKSWNNNNKKNKAYFKFTFPCLPFSPSDSMVSAILVVSFFL